MKFKYLVASHWSIEGWDLPGMDGRTLVEGLNALGSDGWELVLAIAEPAEKNGDALTQYHFKQPA